MGNDDLAGCLGLQLFRQLDAKVFCTRLILHSPHHEVHTGCICLAAQFEWAHVTVDSVCVMQNPLELPLAHVELLQHKVMGLFHKGGGQICGKESLGWVGQSQMEIAVQQHRWQVPMAKDGPSHQQQR